MQNKQLEDILQTEIKEYLKETGALETMRAFAMETRSETVASRTSSPSGGTHEPSKNSLFRRYVEFVNNNAFFKTKLEEMREKLDAYEVKLQATESKIKDLYEIWDKQMKFNLTTIRKIEKIVTESKSSVNGFIEDSSRMSQTPRVEDLIENPSTDRTNRKQETTRSAKHVETPQKEVTGHSNRRTEKHEIVNVENLVAFKDVQFSRNFHTENNGENNMRISENAYSDSSTDLIKQPIISRKKIRKNNAFERSKLGKKSMRKSVSSKYVAECETEILNLDQKNIPSNLYSEKDTLFTPKETFTNEGACIVQIDSSDTDKNPRSPLKTASMETLREDITEKRVRTAETDFNDGNYFHNRLREKQKCENPISLSKDDSTRLQISPSKNRVHRTDEPQLLTFLNDTDQVVSPTSMHDDTIELRIHSNESKTEKHTEDSKKVAKKITEKTEKSKNITHDLTKKINCGCRQRKSSQKNDSKKVSSVDRKQKERNCGESDKRFPKTKSEDVISSIMASRENDAKGHEPATEHQTAKLSSSEKSNVVETATKEPTRTENLNPRTSHRKGRKDEVSEPIITLRRTESIHREDEDGSSWYYKKFGRTCGNEKPGHPHMMNEFGFCKLSRNLASGDSPNDTDNVVISSKPTGPVCEISIDRNTFPIHHTKSPRAKTKSAVEKHMWAARYKETNDSTKILRKASSFGLDERKPTSQSWKDTQNYAEKNSNTIKTKYVYPKCPP